MAENGLYLVSASPHLREGDTVNRIMWSVVLALTPALAMSVYFFGWRALMLLVVSVAAAQAAEVGCLAVRREPLVQALDGSALITGLLLAMLLPASASWYCPLVGSVVAIGIAKHCFGGLGSNIWNPALAGRIFLQFAYPTQISLSRWPVPRALFEGAAASADAVTKASPLFQEAAGPPSSYLDLLLGNGISGCLGETCKLALLAGGVFLILRRCVDWRVPLSYIGVVFALSAILSARGENPPVWINDPLYHILAGGLFVGAFFMATDMVTTPVTRMGRIIFGCGCGLLTVLIRFYAGYPEGVAYSIFIMNTATPLIDRWCRPRVFGSRTSTHSGR